MNAADDRGRRHPGDDPPVHPPRARVRDPADERRDRADGDVRPGRGGGVPGGEEDRRQPQAPEDEPDRGAEQCGDEGAAGGDQEIGASTSAPLLPQGDRPRSDAFGADVVTDSAHSVTDTAQVLDSVIPGGRAPLGGAGRGAGAVAGGRAAGPPERLVVRPAFAARARMNSRSESRFRYASASGFTSSSAASATVTPLGPAAHGAREVEQRRRLGPAREDERAQRLEALVRLVAEPLEPRHLLRGDPRALALRVLERHGQVGAEVEELVLDPLEPRGRNSSGTPRASATPSSAFSSSTVAVGLDPRRSAFETRCPSPRLVWPASPPRV